MDRRSFLKGCAGFAAVAASRGFGVTNLLFDEQVRAATLPGAAHVPPTGRDLLVLIFVRGGMDGLNFVVPHNTSAADANSYYNVLRPTLAIPSPGSSATRKVADLDSAFGLHPDAARGVAGVNVPNMHASDTGGLHKLFTDGDLAIVHACGSPDITGSHFDTELYVDLGGRYRPEGWLGRYLDVVGEPNNALAVAPQSSVPPSMYSITGRAAYAIPNPQTFGPAWRTHVGSNPNDTAALVNQQIALLNGMFNRNIQPAFVEMIGRQTMSQYDPIKNVLSQAYNPAAPYLGDDANEQGYVLDGGQFARALKTVAQLAKASQLAANPLRVATIDVGGGYDTHDNQGTVDWSGNNRYPRLIANISNNIKAFCDDMNALPEWRGRFVVMLLSEFGRVMYENQSGGTDHGSGNVMLVVGSGAQHGTPNINGGRVYSDWPGLQKLGFNHGLTLTTDYRRVISEVLTKRMGATPQQLDQQIFPDVTYDGGYGIAVPA